MSAEFFKKINSKSGESLPELVVAHSPHISNETLTTRRMILDVIIALAPIIGMGIFVFKWYAAKPYGVRAGNKHKLFA